jgi:hypothetical protein
LVLVSGQSSERGAFVHSHEFLLDVATRDALLLKTSSAPRSFSDQSSLPCNLTGMCNEELGSCDVPANFFSHLNVDE